jgi:hypothetical protein
MSREAAGLASRAEGAAEHDRERTPRCVSERAEAAPRGSAVRSVADLIAITE